MRLTTSLPIVVCLAILFASCGNSQSKNEEKSDDVIEESINEAIESGDLKEAQNCDEFIDQYEEWMDDYLVLLEKYMKNPMDATLSSEFMEQAQKGAFWMEQWSTKLVRCASKEKYQKRFEEISERAEKKLEEMGIE